MPHGVMPPEQLASEPSASVPMPGIGRVGRERAGECSAGPRPVMRRLYGDGLTTRQTPAASRRTCTTELPTRVALDVDLRDRLGRRVALPVLEAAARGTRG